MTSLEKIETLAPLGAKHFAGVASECLRFADWCANAGWSAELEMHVSSVIAAAKAAKKAAKREGSPESAAFAAKAVRSAAFAVEVIEDSRAFHARLQKTRE